MVPYVDILLYRDNTTGSYQTQASESRHCTIHGHYNIYEREREQVVDKMAGFSGNHLTGQ
jgi:hypothetical protein